MFIEADADGSGSLDEEEFGKMMLSSGLGLTEREIVRIMRQLDVDHNGKLDFDEFVPIGLQLLEQLCSVVSRRVAQAQGTKQQSEAMGAVLEQMGADDEYDLQGKLVGMFNHYGNL